MMITRISEIIHDRTGWCPGGYATKVKNIDGAGTRFRAVHVPAQRDGSPGAGRLGTPAGSYEHTQPGYFLMAAVGATILFIVGMTLLFGTEPVAAVVLCIMIAVLATMSSLTALCIRFGPVGLYKKTWPLTEIASVKPVTNPWYYGYGLRWTSHGRLFNISGRKAVEILLLSGTTFRIGTDEPEALKAAIEGAQERGSKDLRT
jgi:hypothetical protein